jgi:hypothetical protein
MLVSCPYTLHNYQNSPWEQVVFDRGEWLCGTLRNYNSPYQSWTLQKERKWELVSAFQKSIRRGDKVIALRLISAMESMPTEHAYFWRRLCVIACEDVGPADDCLAAFVIACATSLRKNTEPSSHDRLVADKSVCGADNSNVGGSHTGRGPGGPGRSRRRS